MCILPSGRLEYAYTYLAIIIFQMFYDYIVYFISCFMFKNKCQTLVAVIVNSCKLTLRFIAKSQWVFIH
jgi:hypothetical protein